ncbi:type VI secretion system ImpA family N-terminal domain-containing protein [Erwinia tracheiphila]|uniref:Membrane protein n=2 Tax=Erwinia tracheiphila TaxID=65700 RepID=A0A0M2KHN6_9GAMM|nr:type VI secretion system ImpA family N-terminal domain-containing protein [Erwinia tracheiphila]EOS94469.1 T6SS protein Cts1A [Erwinia tracheiphila PSU-1]KKF36773.1 membrane protein [Erwinia tracheiphila]UIA83708.1 type VI secretion system ImpA family N-terminal domain-containing protein [Erwinia tracheiphila]UIA88111.1 type VI secretion system ImpA family N-terminal domain-containing protein [Erwinia tracheiphila]UIA92290.1 type VI secretion system ImpA family N-terminal domain-containing 
MAEVNIKQLSNYYQHLCEKMGDENPCGENLDYDASFIMLQSKLQPRLGVEYGNFVEAAEPINWAEIERECLSMLQKSKDIRLFIALIRCRLRQTGLAAIHEGLEALRYLLVTFPEDLHPQLLDEGEFDPLLRANAFSELEDVNGLLSDIRNQTLPKAAGLQIAVKDFEKAHASPREEGALPESVISALLLEWDEQENKTIYSLSAAGLCLKEIKALLVDSLGHDAPEFSHIGPLLDLFSNVSSQPLAQAEPVPAEKAPSESVFLAAESIDDTTPPLEKPVTPPSRAAASKGIETRSDALSKLREIRTWFTKMEPSSPVIPLLAFAESTVGKSFSELLKILPAEMIEKMNPDKE